MAKTKHNLTVEQQKYVCSQYYFKTSAQLSKELNVPASKISNVWYKNGCKGKQKYLYVFNQNYFNDIDNEYKAYFLGFIAADGCVHDNHIKKKQNIIRICIHKDDAEVLKTFKKQLNTEKPLSYINKKYVTLELVSDKMFNDLVNLGLAPRKTYGNCFVQLESKLMPHFLRGYFDGDGNISKKTNNSYNVNVGYSGFETNLNKIKNYLQTYNIQASFVVDKRKYNKDSENFGQLAFVNKLEKYCFLKYIYNDAHVYLKRKKIIADEYTQAIENETKPSSKEIITYYKYAVQKVI